MRMLRAPGTVARSATCATALCLLCAAPATGQEVIRSPRSVWSQVVPSSAPLDPQSTRFVTALRSIVAADEAANRGPWIDTKKCASAVYVVGSATPIRHVTLLGSTLPARRSLQAAFSAVPIPTGSTPTVNCRDHTLVIQQPSTGKMWEFWHMAQNTAGNWHADWGGATDDLTTNDGVFGPSDWLNAQTYWGASASGMMTVGGLLTYTELQQGVISHAISLAIPFSSAKIWSDPAVRTDGDGFSLDALPYGAHFRLAPSVNVAALQVPAVTKMLALAAQKYGIIVREQTHHNVGFPARRPPLSDPAIYQRIFGGNGYPGAIMRAFPWDKLQLLRMNLRGDSLRIAAVRAGP